MIYRRFLNVPRWRVRSPFEELDRMRRQMNRLYDEVASTSQPGQAGVFPLLNITEDKNGYHVRAELPGLSSDDLDIQVTHNNLTISGERKIAEEEGARYHRRERSAPFLTEEHARQVPGQELLSLSRTRKRRVSQ